MITISQSGTSSVIMRLNKISQYVEPYYIFELINQNSQEIVRFTGTDVSMVPLSYNEFEFVNGVTLSSTQSFFNLSSGNYFFNVYETNIQYNLNMASASAIYNNELKIEGTLLPSTIYFTQSDADTTKYFE